MLIQQNDIKLVKHIDKLIDALNHISDDVSDRSKKKIDNEKFKMIPFSLNRIESDLNKTSVQLVGSTCNQEFIGNTIIDHIVNIAFSPSNTLMKNAFVLKMLAMMPHSQFWMIILDFITEALFAIKSDDDLMKDIIQSGVFYLDKNTIFNIEQLLQSVFMQCLVEYDHLFQNANEVCIYPMERTLFIDNAHGYVENSVYRWFMSRLNTAMIDIVKFNNAAQNITIEPLIYKRPIYIFKNFSKRTEIEDCRLLVQSMHRHTNAILFCLKNTFDFSDILKSLTNIRCERCTPTTACPHCIERCANIMADAYTTTFHKHATEMEKLFSVSLFLYS